MPERRASDSAVSCRLCHIRHISDWKVLRDDELDELSTGVIRREYASGETVYSIGDTNSGVYCISGGSVGVRKLDEQGNSVLLHLAYPGDTLGYRSFLLSGEHKTSAEALGPTVICHMDSRTISAILERNPELGLQFLRRAASEIDQAHTALMNSLTLCNRARFLHLLLFLIKRHGRLVEDGARFIELPLSRRDLASMIGTRHETVSRIIARLEAEGIARFSGRRVMVPRMDALVAELDSHLAN